MTVYSESLGLKVILYRDVPDHIWFTMATILTVQIKASAGVAHY